MLGTDQLYTKMVDRLSFFTDIFFFSEMFSAFLLMFIKYFTFFYKHLFIMIV